MTAGLKTLWIKKQSNPKQINTSDNQQPSGDKRRGLSHTMTIFSLESPLKSFRFVISADAYAL